MRVLAIDFGIKRMGLAVSDPLGITAQGLPTIERAGLEEDLSRLGKLADQYSAATVVLGNPISHSGNETAMSRRVSEFAEKLRRRLKCPVELWDERLTSAEAGRVLRSSGISIRKRQKAVDRVAATLLLQSFLDHRANELARSQLSGAPE